MHFGIGCKAMIKATHVGTKNLMKNIAYVSVIKWMAKTEPAGKSEKPKVS